MLIIKSHGFKFGRPDANLFFDVSGFINPWREKKIRDEKDPKKQAELISEFMLKQESVKDMVKYYSWLIKAHMEAFPEMTTVVAFCCSAGEYRSPTIAKLVYERLTKMYHFKDISLQQGQFSKL